MRDNFRPNVRLTTNILMVIGTFLIAFNLSKISTEWPFLTKRIAEDKPPIPEPIIAIFIYKYYYAITK